MLASLLGFTGLILTITGIFYFCYWIKHSWIYRKNNRRFNGANFSRKTMQYYHLNNTNVVARWLFGGFTFWNYSRRLQRLSLKGWTYCRKSIWTLNESMEKGYFATLVEKREKRIWIYRFASPLAGLMLLIAYIIGILLVLPIFGVNVLNNSANALEDSALYAVFAIIFIVLIVVGSWIAVAFRIELFKKTKPFLDNCLKNGDLTPHEYTIIRRILKLRLFYALIQAIYNSLQLALRIAQEYNSRSKN